MTQSALEIVRTINDRCEDPNCENGIITGSDYIAADGSIDQHVINCSTCTQNDNDNDIPF